MALALGRKRRGWIPIVVDQTYPRGTPLLMARVLVANRILPVASTAFAYITLRKSQNALGDALLLLVSASLPPGCKPLFLMDRGYAQVALLQKLRAHGIPYLVRGRGTTLVQIGGQWRALARLPHPKGQPVRYRAAYHAQRKEPVDVVVFHDPTFQEPWYLLVPPDSAGRLSTAEVVALSRRRMHIELTFRDWKTHRGVRGLRLEVDVQERLARRALATLLTALRTGVAAMALAPPGRRPLRASPPARLPAPAAAACLLQRDPGPCALARGPRPARGAPPR